jgi:hypothetical protein
VLAASQPVPDRPFSGRKVTSNVRIEAESGSILAARAFDPDLSVGHHLAVMLQGSHGEVALVHGLAVFMSSERFTWSAPHI